MTLLYMRCGIVWYNHHSMSLVVCMVWSLFNWWHFILFWKDTYVLLCYMYSSCRAFVMVCFQLIILLYSSLPFYSDCASWSPSQCDVHSFIEFSFGLGNELFILDIFQVKTAFIVEALCLCHGSILFVMSHFEKLSSLMWAGTYQGSLEGV
jgi:hypothetical protein